MKVQVLLMANVLEVLKVRKDERKTENTLQEMVMQPRLLQLCVLLALSLYLHNALPLVRDGKACLLVSN